MKPFKPFLKIEEVADLLNLDYKTVYRLVLSGQIPAAKIGGSYRIRPEDLDEFFERQKVSARAAEERAGISELASCARCGLAFRVPSLVAGKCQESDCDAPLCVNCWEAAEDRFCSDHIRPKPSLTLHQAEELYRKGDLAVLQKAPKARQLEANFIGRFEQAVQRQRGLASPVDGSWVPVTDWKSLHREERSLLPAPGGGSLVVGYRPSFRLVPRNPTSCYYVTPGTGKGGSFAICGASFSHISTYARQGFDTAPATQAELINIIENALEIARAREVLLLLGLGSPTGWDAEAEESILGSATASGFSHASLAVVLIDLFHNTIKLNPADHRLGPVADLFLGEMEEETLTRVAGSLRQALLIRESLSLRQAMEVSGASEPVVLKAFTRLRSEGGYRVDWLKGLGTVISKG